MKPTVKEFFDPATWTLTYVAFDPTSLDAVIIDPVWDFDPASGKLSDHSAQKVIDFVSQKGLTIHLILETHAHADHVTGAQILKKAFPKARVAIGNRITEVQKIFAPIFNYNSNFNIEGRQFDLLLSEDQILKAGSLSIRTIFTPGHTPACSSYLIGDTLFTGDALFQPDSGTGRCDFPAGNANELYHSVHEKIFSLPDDTRVFTGHDYQPNGRALEFQSTIGQQKRDNIHIKSHTRETDFVQFRTDRDRGLSAPRLLLPSIQINIAGGQLPECENNGVRYLKIPIKQ